MEFCLPNSKALPSSSICFDGHERQSPVDAESTLTSPHPLQGKGMSSCSRGESGYAMGDSMVTSRIPGPRQVPCSNFPA